MMPLMWGVQHSYSSVKRRTGNVHFVPIADIAHLLWRPFAMDFEIPDS